MKVFILVSLLLLASCESMEQQHEPNKIVIQSLEIQENDTRFEGSLHLLQRLNK